MPIFAFDVKKNSNICYSEDKELGDGSEGSGVSDEDSDLEIDKEPNSVAKVNNGSSSNNRSS
jgi:hypothetical protein